MVESVLIVALVVVLIGVTAMSIWLGRTVNVGLDLPLVQTTADLDRALYHQLRRANAQVLCTGPGSYRLRTPYTPAWAIVAMVVTFPIGLLFLIVTAHRDLHVVLVPGSNVLRCTGVARVTTWQQVSRLVSPLVDVRTDRAANLTS